MKNSRKFLLIFLALTMLFTSCGGKQTPPDIPDGDAGLTDPFNPGEPPFSPGGEPQDKTTDAPVINVTEGVTTPPEELIDGAEEGRFEGEVNDITVTRISGTKNAYTIKDNTLTFTSVNEDSVYSISGKLNGNIIIDCGDECRFDLELHGLSLVSTVECPISVLSGDEVSITAKKGYSNFIYDDRDAAAEDEISYAIHSEVDLEICGKGELTVNSQNNKGIHSKKDLQVKNLDLKIYCSDNALKGDDSVEIEAANTTLVSRQGDGIKTKNSDISSKGNQRGNVTLNGGTHYIYAACDGIDAAYNVIIDNTETALNIYTDKYSSFSEEVTAVAEDTFYIRFTSKAYSYSVLFYNSDEDSIWVNAEYHSEVSGGRSKYYYYSLPNMPDYSKMQVYIYESGMKQGQADDYLAATDLMTVNNAYDTFALTARGNSLNYSWTNYTTQVNDDFGFGGRPGGPGGMGGFGEGNTDKGEYSTKGIKAANEIIINNGSIYIRSYDDALHANNDTTLENGAAPLGNVTVNGGSITVLSNDDGLHADGILQINSGTVTVAESYEGLEASNVIVKGGNISVSSSDDGINSTATSGTGVALEGGKVYIYCTGDGIDSNSRSSYTGIIFGGADVVVISNSGGNSAIDTEQGYSYTGGRVLAVMPSRGMTNEATHCKNFSSVATSTTANLTSGKILSVSADGAAQVSATIPATISARIIYLGDNNASIKTVDTVSEQFDTNGVKWY